MRILVLLAFLAPSVALSKVNTPPLAKGCAPGSLIAGVNPSKTVKARPLGAEPPAAQVLALYRKVDGCPKPIVLRKGLGMNKDGQQPIEGDGTTRRLAP